MNDNKNIYRTTLNLPNTNFSLRDELSKFQKINIFWKNNNIYEKKIEKNKDKKTFILHSGPSYANGKIHMGHFLNSILKDIIVRFFSKEFYTPFILGWDAHGLPIELEVLKKKKTNNFNSLSQKKEENESISLNSFRIFASEQINIQRSQIFNLGIFTNFDYYYSTMSKTYEAEQIRFFAELVKKKLIFSDFRPVYWSCSNKTALAQNEIIYLKKETNSVYFKFPLLELSDNKFSHLFGKENISFLVWTTQAWTIIANKFLAVNTNGKYNIIFFKNEYFVVSNDSLQYIFNEEEMKNVSIKAEFLGSYLLNSKYANPLSFNFDIGGSYIISGDNFVNCSEGTGIVHLAPAFGEEDFFLSKDRLDEIVCPLDEDGRFNKDIKLSKFIDKYYYQVNDLVIDFLSDSNCLFKLKTIIHEYPHDWRDKTPLIFRLTKQWFINTNKIKEFSLSNAEKVIWKPSWGIDKMKNMLKEQNNWCISRQRTWGVPLPIIYELNNDDFGKTQKKAILDYKIINFVADILEVEGVDVWFNDGIIKRIKEKFINLKTANIVLEKDVMDVWFDSSISYFCLLKKGILEYSPLLINK